MAERQRQSDEAGGSNQEWMVTFSDCMTLLLTFFVMLLAYATFEKETSVSVSGSLIERNDPSVHTRKRHPKDHPTDPPPREIDRTAHGSEKPTRDRLEPNLRPRDPLELTSIDAYRDRRILTIPSRLLFWGQGAQIKADGRRLLKPVAQYLRLVSSRVVIAETSAADAAAAGAGDAEHQRALGRAWAVLNYFTRTKRLEAGRFNLSTSAVPDAPDEPALVIAVLNPEAYP